MKTLLLLSALGVLAFSSPCFAAEQDDHGDMQIQHGMMQSTGSIYDKDMQAMHKAMAIRATGDADVDFVRSMIPHHEGAVAMAQTLLKNGKDPEIHQLAEDIIAAQEREITFMQDWLKKHKAGQ